MNASSVAVRPDPATSANRGGYFRAWMALVLLVPVCLEASYYLVGWARGGETSLLVMYRPTLGDRDYFPVVRQVADLQLGEAYTREFRGHGMMSFPWASVLPHALLMAAFGPVGFALADIFVPCGYAALLFLFLIRTGSGVFQSALLAVFSALLGFGGLSAQLIAAFGYHLRGLPFYLEFLQSWSLRFPRPFVSTLYALGALGCWIGLARQSWPVRRGWWIATAAWMAAVLQSDIYTFCALGLAFVAVALLGFAWERRLPARRELGPLLPGIVVFLVLALPFLLARRFEHPDVSGRFGMFVVSGSSFPLLSRAAHFFPASFTVASLVLPLTATIMLRRRGAWDETLPPRLAGMLILLQLSGYVTMFLFVILTGRGIQLYHFRDTAQFLVSLSTIACFGLFLTALGRRIRVGSSIRRLFAALAVGLVAVSSSATVLRTVRQHLDNSGTPRSVLGQELPWSKTYRADLMSLAQELDRLWDEGSREIATLDPEVYAWWTGFRGGASFLPHAFVSSVSNAEIEKRLGIFARLNQLSSDEAVALIDYPTSNRVLESFHSAARYQATRFHTFAPLGDYTPAEQVRITQTDPLDWNLIVPGSEKRRLAQLFAAQPELHRGVDWNFDLLVTSTEWPQLAPDPRLFRLVYQNPTFSVHQAVAAATEAPPGSPRVPSPKTAE